MIDKNTLIERSSDILHTELDNEVIMMSIETGEYHGTNAVGNRIWELLEEPNSFTSICEHLMQEYEVEKTVCEKEVYAFLKVLFEKNLIIMQENA